MVGLVVLIGVFFLLPLLRLDGWILTRAFTPAEARHMPLPQGFSSIADFYGGKVGKAHLLRIGNLIWGVHGPR
jgi:hypothetical protein